MYIKIGTDSKPLGLKVSGGFIVDAPILKITNYQVQRNVYSGTPDKAFKVIPTTIYPVTPQLSVTVMYYKSYEDYLNLETPIIFPTTSQEPASLSVLPNTFFNLEIVGDITETSIHKVLETKLLETYKNVSVVAE